MGQGFAVMEMSEYWKSWRRSNVYNLNIILNMEEPFKGRINWESESSYLPSCLQKLTMKCVFLFFNIFDFKGNFRSISFLSFVEMQLTSHQCTYNPIWRCDYAKDNDKGNNMFVLSTFLKSNMLMDGKQTSLIFSYYVTFLVICVAWQLLDVNLICFLLWRLDIYS